MQYVTTEGSATTSGAREVESKHPWDTIPLYQEQGIPTIWLVDLEAACVEVWTPTDVRPVIVHDTLTWHAPGAAQPLQLNVDELLRSN